MPGLGPIWQADDGEHRAVTLGAEDDHTPVHPTDAPLPKPPAAEDHDPRPERQPPDSDA